MTTPSELVTEQFENAQSYAADAFDLAESFLSSFADNLYTAPTVDLTWDTIDAPDVVAPPDAPTITDIVDDLEAAPVLTIPDAPDVTVGDVPEVAAVADVVVPDAPVLDDVAAPTYLDLSTPTFAGVDLNAAFLDDLEASIPSLSLVAPTPYNYTPSAAYTSTLKSTLSTLIATHLAGGTGLSPTVEAEIWGRASDRESATAADNITETTKGFQNLGWNLPTGAIAAAVRRARQNLRNRMADLSREVAIKQAELEQANVQHAIERGIAWEGQLIGYSLELEKIAFESAKAVAQNAIDIHNAGLEEFKALVQLLSARAAIYESIIRGELAKVEVYKAEIAAEQAKADANRTIVEQFKAQLDARMANVRVYEAQLNGVRALIELEKTKVEASAEQIRGFVAGANAQLAKLEVFKAQVSGQLGLAEIYRTKATAFQARVSAQSEIARNKLVAYEATIRAIESENTMNARLFEALVHQYDAQQTYTLNGQKINSDIIAANNAVLLKAKEAATQILAQLAGSALGAAHASAAVSGSGSTSVSYSYSNDTNATVDPVTLI